MRIVITSARGINLDGLISTNYCGINSRLLSRAARPEAAGRSRSRSVY